MLHMTIRRALCALLFLSAPLIAQDTTRGVRIGLTYDPGSKPGIVVLPGRGLGADSSRWDPGGLTGQIDQSARLS